MNKGPWPGNFLITKSLIEKDNRIRLIQKFQNQFSLKIILQPFSCIAAYTKIDRNNLLASSLSQCKGKINCLFKYRILKPNLRITKFRLSQHIIQPVIREFGNRHFFRVWIFATAVEKQVLMVTYKREHTQLREPWVWIDHDDILSIFFCNFLMNRLQYSKPAGKPLYHISPAGINDFCYSDMGISSKYILEFTAPYDDDLSIRESEGQTLNQYAGDGDIRTYGHSWKEEYLFRRRFHA